MSGEDTNRADLPMDVLENVAAGLCFVVTLSSHLECSVNIGLPRFQRRLFETKKINRVTRYVVSSLSDINASSNGSDVESRILS